VIHDSTHCQLTHSALTQLHRHQHLLIMYTCSTVCALLLLTSTTCSIEVQAVAPVPPPGLQHLLQKEGGPGGTQQQQAQPQSFIARYVSAVITASSFTAVSRLHTRVLMVLRFEQLCCGLCSVLVVVGLTV
jgi:hypothetical protein